MQRSESIAELTKALSKAQSVIEGATKDKDNPHFRSKYADLGNCWDAARKPLTDNGLAIIQSARLAETGVEVETLLTHASGEWVSDTLTVPVAKRDAHGVGAAITYGRRFSLCAFAGIASEDDDGNKAVGKETVKEIATAPSGSAREVAQDAYNLMDKDAQAWIGNIATKLTAMVKVDPIAAVDYLEEENLTNEDKLGLWFLLDSTTRSALKREQARRTERKVA